MGEAKKRKLSGISPRTSQVDWAKIVVNWNEAQSAFEAAIINAGRPSTPLAPLTGRISRFCQSISPDMPEFLPFSDQGLSYRPGLCIANCLHMVEHKGGMAVNGWMIWENRNYAEAEFHCVWHPPGGTFLVDVTPRVDREKTVLFLPDSTVAIRPGPKGGDLMPCNRTTIPKCPFARGTMAVDQSTYEVHLDYGSSKELDRLGFKKKRPLVVRP